MLTSSSTPTRHSLSSGAATHVPPPSSVFDGLVEYKQRTAASPHPSAARPSLAYRSIAAPTTGVISSFRVLEGSLRDHRAQQQERSVVDALLEDDNERHAALSGPFRLGQYNSNVDRIGDRLKVTSQRPDVRVWSEEETMAIASSVAAHQQAVRRLAESVQFGRIPEENEGRQRIAAEEEELRSLLAWRRLHDMQHVAAGGWSSK
jgi:hypothetical protein